jgi:hypothetical protein
MNTLEIAMEKLLRISEKTLGEKYAGRFESSKEVSEEKGFGDTETLLKEWILAKQVEMDREAKES